MCLCGRTIGLCCSQSVRILTIQVPERRHVTQLDAKNHQDAYERGHVKRLKPETAVFKRCRKQQHEQNRPAREEHTSSINHIRKTKLEIVAQRTYQLSNTFEINTIWWVQGWCSCLYLAVCFIFSLSRIYVPDSALYLYPNGQPCTHRWSTSLRRNTTTVLTSNARTLKVTTPNLQSYKLAQHWSRWSPSNVTTRTACRMHSREHILPPFASRFLTTSSSTIQYLDCKPAEST